MVPLLKQRRPRFLAALLSSLFVIGSWPASAVPSAQPLVEWTRQFGAGGLDYLRDLDATSDSVYTVEQAGTEADVVVRRMGPGGSTLWSRAFQWSQHNVPGAIKVVGDRVYVVGSARPSEGDWDGFVRAYATDGTLLWNRMVESEAADLLTAVTATTDAVFVAGTTKGSIAGTPAAGGLDVFVRRLSLAGTTEWTRQFGTAAADRVGAVVVSDGGVVVAGETGGTLPGASSAGATDGYLRKYLFLGALGWTRQFGTSQRDSVNGASADATGIYLAGSTTGTLGASNEGDEDAFLRRVTTTGDVEWTRQFGTDVLDVAHDVEAFAGNVYVTGSTAGAIRGGTSNGWFDGFVRRYTREGAAVWTHQFGTDSFENAITVDGSPTGVYVAGETGGALGGSAGGDSDGFIRRIVSHRPDGLISAGGAYVGNDRYAGDAGQTVSAQLDAGATRVFPVRVQNDGDTRSGVRVDGCAPGSGFRIRYLAGFRGSTDITSAVVAGEYVVSDLAPNEVGALRMVVTIGPAAEPGSVRTCAVGLTSTLSSTVRDVVRARITADY